MTGWCQNDAIYVLLYQINYKSDTTMPFSLQTDRHTTLSRLLTRIELTRPLLGLPALATIVSSIPDSALSYGAVGMCGSVTESMFMFSHFSCLCVWCVVYLSEHTPTPLPTPAVTPLMSLGIPQVLNVL